MTRKIENCDLKAIGKRVKGIQDSKGLTNEDMARIQIPTQPGRAGYVEPLCRYATNCLFHLIMWNPCEL